jgi:hypothetical protein
MIWPARNVDDGEDVALTPSDLLVEYNGRHAEVKVGVTYKTETPKESWLVGEKFYIAIQLCHTTRQLFQHAHMVSSAVCNEAQPILSTTTSAAAAFRVTRKIKKSRKPNCN